MVSPNTTLVLGRKAAFSSSSVHSRVYEGGSNAHLRHGDGDEVEGAAVDGAGGHDVVPCLADIEQRKEVCGLTAGGEHGGSAALQLADLFGYHIAGGVLQAGVEIAVGLQVEQLAHVLAGSVLEGGGLDDGDLAGLAVAGGVAALHADGITVHTTYSFAGFLVGIGRFPAGGAASGGESKIQSDSYFPQALIALGGPQGTHRLERLHHQHQQHHTDDHDVGLVAVVAVGQGDLAQTAAADDAGHGGVAQNGGQCGGHAGDQAGQALRDHDLGDDLEGGSAHALGSFHHALVQLPQAGLHQTCHKGEGGDHQRNDGGLGAHRSAHDGAGKREYTDHQNQERHAAQNVDDNVDQMHQPAGQGQDAVLVTGYQQHTQRQTQHQRKGGGEHRYIKGLPDGKAVICDIHIPVTSSTVTPDWLRIYSIACCATASSAGSLSSMEP